MKCCKTTFPHCKKKFKRRCTAEQRTGTRRLFMRMRTTDILHVLFTRCVVLSSFANAKLVIRLLTIKRAWAVWTLGNMSFNNTLNSGFSRSTSGKITRKIVSKRSQFTEELCQRISGTQIECRRRQRIEFDRRNVVTALSSFPYENLRKTIYSR